MTNNLKEQLENILGPLHLTAMTGSGKDYDVAEEVDDAVELILALINQKEREARLDEYAWYKREYPTAPYMPGFIIEDRIKQLKEELNGTQQI